MDPHTFVFTTVIPPGVKAIREGAAAHFGIELKDAQVSRDKARCDKKWSEHCECGAIDFFPLPSHGIDLVRGRRIFDFFVANEEALGIQIVIFNRRVIGGGSAVEREYTEDHPHTDHLHVGINQSARQTITRELVDECLAMEEFRMFTEAELANLKELAALSPASLSRLAAPSVRQP